MEMSELALPEEDYNLQEFFPKTIRYDLQSLIEHRVKLILKENTTFNSGEIKVVNTCIMLNGKLKGSKLSMFLIPTENEIGFPIWGVHQYQLQRKSFSETCQLFRKES